MKRWRRLAALVVSLAIMVAIFSRLDLAGFVAVFRKMDWAWFGASLVMFLPQGLIRAARLRALMGGGLAFKDALRMVTAAGSLNMLLPSKGGDLMKSLFMRQHMEVTLKASVAAVVLERVLDVAALVLLLVAGLVLVRDGRELLFVVGAGAAALGGGVAVYFLFHFWRGADSLLLPVIQRIPKVAPLVETSRGFVARQWSEGRLPVVMAWSLVLWIVQVFQFVCFFFSLGFQGPLAAIVAFVPAAIFFGMLPVTLAGIGTRDVALIVLFAPWAPAETMAGVALLSHLRYLIPGLIGVLVTYRYVRDMSAP